MEEKIEINCYGNIYIALHKSSFLILKLLWMLPYTFMDRDLNPRYIYIKLHVTCPNLLKLKARSKQYYTSPG